MFKKIGFTLLFLVELLALSIAGSMFGTPITYYLTQINPASGVLTTAATYLNFTGIWIAVVIYLLVFKRNRPILAKFGTKAKGNTVPFLLLGLLIGFGLNGFCALVAMINGNISLSFDNFNPLSFVFVFFAVFIQSSAEEILCRGVFYQRLNKVYGKPAVAAVLNALLFSAMHLLNPDVNVFGLINIVIVGILMSLPVYFFDSIWCAFGIHAAWNFTQNILLGLPNSGLVMPYSVFKLNPGATDSFAYNVGFGIEGTILSIVVLTAATIVFFIVGTKINSKAKVGDEALESDIAVLEEAVDEA